MKQFKIYSTRVQTVCAIVTVQDEDYLDDSICYLAPEDWEVVQTIEPQEIESYFGVNRDEFSEDTNENHSPVCVC
jgi:hypothetical protein